MDSRVNMKLGLLCIAESQVHTAYNGRKTPTKGFYSFLRVVITKNSTCRVAKVVIHIVETFLLFNIVSFSKTRGFWSSRT